MAAGSSSGNMTTSEFYHRARTDSAFRRTQLENLRYYKIVGTGLVWTFALLGIAITLYGGISRHRWSDGLGVGADLAIVTLARVWCVHRIARLEAFETATE